MHTKTHQPPICVAPDTWVIHDHSGEGHAPVLVPLNSMVIRAAQPVVVDTGMGDNEEQYLADLFSIVEPEDIRWVFVSHDDIDHTGNVNRLMELAPNATLVLNWFMQERMGATLQVPPHRQRWVRDGESFPVGDRTLHAVRPPVYDSPTTRGLFDPTTGVYWASDSFATPMLAPVDHVEAIDPTFWHDGMAMFHQYVSPWYAIADDTRFQRTVSRVEALGVSTIAGCHTPTVGAGSVARAFEQMRTFPSVTVPAEPGQEVLDQIVATLSVTATP